MQTKYISTTETAKIVRQALKKAFPLVKFSVRSKSYSGGSSIDIDWTDGPTTRQAEVITKGFTGAGFDPCQDLKSYHTQEHNGETVHFGADYIFCYRGYTPEFLQKVSDKMTVASQDNRARPAEWNYSHEEIVDRNASRTFFYNGMRCMEK